MRSPWGLRRINSRLQPQAVNFLAGWKTASAVHAATAEGPCPEPSLEFTVHGFQKRSGRIRSLLFDRILPEQLLYRRIHLVQQLLSAVAEFLVGDASPD